MTLIGASILSLFNENIIVKLLTEYSSITRTNLLQIIGYRFAIGLIPSLSLLIYFNISNTGIPFGVLAVFVCSILFQSFDVVDYFFQSKQNFKKIVLIRNGTFIVVSILKLICVLYDLGFNFIYLSYTFEFFIISVFFLYFLFK